MVTTDQHRWDCIGVARSKHQVMTPHIDQLASEGVRFDRAYSDCPLCIPARTSIMTGKSAYEHGIDTNGEFSIPAKPQDTLPGRLTSLGYQTHAAGKMHFSPPRNRNGFERMRLIPEDYVNWLESTPYRGKYRGHGLGGNEVYPVYHAVPIEYSTNHWVVEESIDFLRQRDTDAPFFMWTSFEDPHAPFDPPESFVRLYDDMPIEPPVDNDWSGHDDIPDWVQRRIWSHKLDELSQEVILAARKHYYAQITHIDYELGRLLGELRSQGLWENTIILFTSDHGEMLGDHGLFHKSCFYDPSARVPFILKIPDQWNRSWRPGSVESTPITLADIFPTLLDLSGCLQEEDVSAGEGRSIMRINSNRLIYGFINHDGKSYMVTDGSLKYIYYPEGGKEQFFDLKNDPYEQINLVDKTDSENMLSLEEFRTHLINKFPSIGQVKADGKVQLYKEESSLLNQEQEKSTNPFAWRGPIRYGGHW